MAKTVTAHPPHNSLRQLNHSPCAEHGCAQKSAGPCVAIVQLLLGSQSFYRKLLALASLALLLLLCHAQSTHRHSSDTQCQGQSLYPTSDTQPTRSTQCTRFWEHWLCVCTDPLMPAHHSRPSPFPPTRHALAVAALSQAWVEQKGSGRTMPSWLLESA